MKHPVLTLVAGTAAGLLSTNPGAAHSGSLDGNGCHYEAGYRNYRGHRDPTPEDCVRSGGRRYGS